MIKQWIKMEYDALQGIEPSMNSGSTNTPTSTNANNAAIALSLGKTAVFEKF